MKRVALYIRVSTEEQAVHGLSIEAQTQALDQWAKENKVKIVGHYVDAGISARKPASKRPELQKLLQEVQSGKIDMIVFTKLDRWFRNIAEYYKVQDVLEKYRVDWKTIHEDYDTSTASGRLKINIMLSVAQDEADRTSERIKAVFETKRERREPLTGNKPTGYKIESKKFVKDENLAPVIDAFFKKFLQCGSVGETQSYIQETFGIFWGYYIVDKLLSSTAYYGKYYGVDDMCPPYITKEQFDKIQTMRHRVVRKPKKEARVYMFSGILVCGECGYRLGGRMQRTSKYPTYNCAEHYLNKKCPNNNTISENKIEQYLIDTAAIKLHQYKTQAENLHAIKKGRDIKAEISAIRSKLGRLKDLYVNDFITMDEYKADRENLTQKLELLENEGRPAEFVNIEKIESILSEDWKDSYFNLDRASQRDFWKTIIKEIRFYKDRHIDYDFV